jgi:hypothetical protein
MTPKSTPGFAFRRRHRALHDVEIQHQRPPIVFPERHALSGAVLDEGQLQLAQRIRRITRLPSNSAAGSRTLGLAVDALEAHGAISVFELDVATNRPDCLSHQACAREALRYTDCR